VTLKEAAQSWGVSVSRVRALVKQGRVKVKKVKTHLTASGYYYQVLDTDKPTDPRKGR
jgi:predicted site-specific integrase-resolvase